MGAPVTSNLATGATFSIDTGGFMLPSGLNFASANDLMVGQKVRLHPTGPPTGTPPNLMITVDQVQLEPSHVTATITAINTGGNPQTFTWSLDSVHSKPVMTTGIRFLSNRQSRAVASEYLPLFTQWRVSSDRQPLSRKS